MLNVKKNLIGIKSEFFFLNLAVRYLPTTGFGYARFRQARY